jgi:hypothetical protein
MRPQAIEIQGITDLWEPKNQPARKSWIKLLQAREQHIQKNLPIRLLSCPTKDSGRLVNGLLKRILFRGKSFRELHGLARLHCDIPVCGHKSAADQAYFVLSRL